MTTEEFEDVILCMWPGVKKKLQDGGYKAVLSYDNVASQAGAILRSMGLTDAERVNLPPYSPDMHKIIEHTFHRLKDEVYKHCYAFGTEISATELQSIVRAAFAVVASRETIRADSCSLVDTYRCIATPKDQEWIDRKGHRHLGSGGDWPPYQLR
jgi:hypothetical protein